METIYYDTKETTARTVYLELSQQDHDMVLSRVLAISAYMAEIAISQDNNLQEIVKYWTLPNKKYRKNKKLGCYNSPQSYYAGIINNLVYGTQNDFSLTQLTTIQEINNAVVDIRAICDVDLQPNYVLTKLSIQEKLWSFQ